VRSHKGTHFTVAPPTFPLIPSTPSAVFSTVAAPTGIENIKMYLVIAVFARVDIIYKSVTKIVKDVWAIDRGLSKLKDSLSEIKDKFTFIRCGITIFIHNTGLLNI